jgi:hypothetical protein
MRVERSYLQRLDTAINAEYPRPRPILIGRLRLKVG